MLCLSAPPDQLSRTPCLTVALAARSCTFRFPSTNIKLVFQSLVDEKQGDKGADRQQNREAFKSAIAPLKVNIPDSSSDFVSPAPSPTGTIRSVSLVALTCR